MFRKHRLRTFIRREFCKFSAGESATTQLMRGQAASARAAFGSARMQAVLTGLQALPYMPVRLSRGGCFHGLDQGVRDRSREQACAGKRSAARGPLEGYPVTMGSRCVVVR